VHVTNHGPQQAKAIGTAALTAAAKGVCVILQDMLSCVPASSCKTCFFV